MKRQLPESDLETAFELIATAIDRVGREHESIFLAKLALALATQLRSVDAISFAISSAERDMKR